MFAQDITPVERPLMVVHAPGMEFIHKYFDREFDRDITGELPDTGDIAGAVMVVSTLEPTTSGAPQKAPTQAASTDTATKMAAYTGWCARRGLRPVIVRVPHVVGTGMRGLPLTLARGVMRGTMLCIRDNEARIAVIHAVDIPRVVRAINDAGGTEPVDITVSAPAVRVNDLIQALGHRIKDKRVGTIKPRWARALYGSQRYAELTTDYTVDTTEFASRFPDFEFVNPVEYLTTHVYDDESL